MEIVCPLDIEFSDRIAALLSPPSPQAAQDYFDQLIIARKCHGLKVKQCEEYGKGVYATLDFEDGELLLKDQMLVGAQHSSNKLDCLVCSYCFRYIGSIELQIGRRLYLQSLGLPTKKEHDLETSSHSSEESCQDEMPDEEDSICRRNHDNLWSCSSGDMKGNLLPNEVIEALMNGGMTLPHSKQFILPAVVSCPGGCEEEHYCSKSCAESDWEFFHSLLCTGKRPESSCREALVNFIEHSNATNDIFLLAAKLISFTILKYKKLKSASLREQNQHIRINGMDDWSFSLLMLAWKPISVGFKRRWWDCIALPDDVDRSNEASFRIQIKELAFTSLQLLKEAIFDKECAPLFSLEIYGHIIGMFELNNLDLVVASPVEDYFIYIDDLQHPEKVEAETVTRCFLDALGDDYSACCQGTAFFPLQSCMNHSCCPNAKAFKRDEDRDGQATVIALRPIRKGEEITISYIDEELPYENRQALLADYGFRCQCPKCLEGL